MAPCVQTLDTHRDERLGRCFKCVLQLFPEDSEKVADLDQPQAYKQGQTDKLGTHTRMQHGAQLTCFTTADLRSPNCTPSGPISNFKTFGMAS